MVQRIAGWGKYQKYCERDGSVRVKETHWRRRLRFSSTVSHIPMKNEVKARILGLDVILKQAFILRNFAVSTFVTIFNRHISWFSNPQGVQKTRTKL